MTGPGAASFLGSMLAGRPHPGPRSACASPHRPARCPSLAPRSPRGGVPFTPGPVSAGRAVNPRRAPEGILEAFWPLRGLGEVLEFSVAHAFEEHLVHVLVLVAVDAVAADVEHELARPDAASESRRARPGRLPSVSGAAAPASSVKFCITAGGGSTSLALHPEFTAKHEGELMVADQLDESHHDRVFPEPVRGHFAPPGARARGQSPTPSRPTPPRPPPSTAARSRAAPTPRAASPTGAPRVPSAPPAAPDAPPPARAPSAATARAVASGSSTGAFCLPMGHRLYHGAPPPGTPPRAPDPDPPSIRARAPISNNPAT